MFKHIISRLRDANTSWSNLNRRTEHIEELLQELKAQCEELEANQALLVSCLVDLTGKINKLPNTNKTSTNRK